jgi:hypothetical protein
MLFGLSINPIDFFGLFLLLAGFVIGLGAVTVIDIHGFLGMKSEYWTEATTRTHKVTKPMIWTGICLAIFGGLLFYRNETLSGIPLMHACIASILLLNGCFLSCSVSPYLIKREKEGKSHKILPPSWQKRIAISLIISDIGWWSALMLLVAYLLNS